MKTTKVLLASVFLVLAVSCGDSGTTDGGFTPDGMGPDGNGLPSVTATLNPTTVMPGDAVTITIMVQNFTLVDMATHTTDVAGEGHYRVYADNDNMGDYTVEDFVSPVVVNVPATAPAGIHTYRVELVTNTGMMLTPQTSTPPIPFTVQ